MQLMEFNDLKKLAFAAAHKLAIGATLGIVGAIIGLVVYMKKTGTSVDDHKVLLELRFKTNKS